MTIGPIQLIRQATPGQRRTLLAAALGWALDAFDTMLYALVLALLMRDFGMSKTTAGLLGTLTLLASGSGGCVVRFSRRPHRAQAGADGEHSDLLGVFVRFRAGDEHRHACGGAVRSRSGYGWRMEYWGDAGGGELAHGVSSQGNFLSAEFVGFGLCRGGTGSRAGGAVFRLAGCVLRGYSAGTVDVVDSARSAGVGDVGRARVAGTAYSPRPWRWQRRRSKLRLVDPRHEVFGDFSAAICAADVRSAAI